MFDNASDNIRLDKRNYGIVIYLDWFLCFL